MNRGSRRSQPTSSGNRWCFNEAPIHESGKWRTSASLRVPSSGFNEAPIHESGKWESAYIVSVNTLGFNEAPIHESGKC